MRKEAASEAADAEKKMESGDEEKGVKKMEIHAEKPKKR